MPTVLVTSTLPSDAVVDPVADILRVDVADAVARDVADARAEELPVVDTTAVRVSLTRVARAVSVRDPVVAALADSVTTRVTLPVEAASCVVTAVAAVDVDTDAVATDDALTASDSRVCVRAGVRVGEFAGVSGADANADADADDESFDERVKDALDDELAEAIADS
jgi:hypothetical protein